MNYKKNFKNYMYFEITTSIYPGNTSSGYLVSCLYSWTELMHLTANANREQGCLTTISDIYP